MDPQRLELMSAFADKLLEKPPARRYESDDETVLPRFLERDGRFYTERETWDAISHVFETPREGEPKWDEEFEPFPAGSGRPPPRMHHNWFARLFLRQEKYKSRGIRLLDAPPNFATVEERIEIKTVSYAGGG